MTRNQKTFPSLSTYYLQHALVFFATIGILAVASLRVPKADASGTLSGRVFQDFNSNGNYDTSGGTTAAPTAVDAGMQNVTVTAYDSNGVAQGSTTTAADGTFNLIANGTGPYRLEFTNLPAGFQPAARSTNSLLGGSATDSGTATQFVADGNTANINFAVNRPADYCQNNPDICATTYSFGDQGDSSIFIVPFTAGSTRTTGGRLDPNGQSDFTNGTRTNLVMTSAVGTTYGMAYSRAARKIFAASFMKKHSAFGPDGPGAIYQIDRNNGDAVSLYANINALFAGNPAGTNPHNTADYNTDNGNTTWDAVGKISFGGMAISDDDAKLYVMNLNNRTLYEIPANQTPTAANIRMSAFPATMPNCPNSDDVRPFAVTFHEGQIYVGAVCSADSTDLVTDLRAYVYQVNPTTLAYGANPVFQAPLNYTRLEIDPGYSAAWKAWRETYSTISTSHFIYPQPMLTDIGFDRGNLILALRDRNGDQTGYNSASNPSNSTQLRKGITGGDILRACGSLAGGWTLESNGRCGGNGTATQNTNEGPGGGEFYFQDNYHPNGAPHDEVAVGGVLQIPGFNVMTATIFDPIYVPNENIYDSGGFRWFSNTTGAQNRGYLAYDATTGDFGKANGIGGNVPALCNAAPIEIGNRVWKDVNHNGVQDPSESRAAATPVLASGITVRLYGPANNLLGTAVTDQDGEYYFSSAPGTNTTNAIYNLTLQPNTNYQIRFDNAADYQNGGPLFGWNLTYANVSSQPGDKDSSDSDAVNVTNPVGSPTAGTFPVISLTTGAAGTNNHTFDVGFSQAPTAAEATVAGRVLSAQGRGIRNVLVTLTEQDGTRHEVMTGVFGYYRFAEISVGQTVVVSVSAKRYNFEPDVQTLTVNEDVENLDFNAGGGKIFGWK